ncbi:ERMES complex subunit mmm1, partial [Nowakowskiella sp. JEL0078]
MGEIVGNTVNAPPAEQGAASVGHNSAFELLKNEVNLANQEFFKGFIAGQIALILLLFFLINVFLLQGASGTKQDLLRRNLNKPKVSVKGVKQANLVDSHILENTQYEMLAKREETCDWLNVLIAQVLAKYRNDAGFNNRIVTILDDMVNLPTKPAFM